MASHDEARERYAQLTLEELIEQTVELQTREDATRHALVAWNEALEAFKRAKSKPDKVKRKRELELAEERVRKLLLSLSMRGR